MRQAGRALLALMVLAGPAQAQDATPHVAAYTVALHAASIKLDFHGDEATGCARRGLCDTTGTVTAAMSPKRNVPGSGFVTASGNRLFGIFTLFLDGLTRAVVRTEGAPDCRDDAYRNFEPLSLAADPKLPGRMVLGTAGLLEILAENGGNFGSSGGEDDIFVTRCAGPSPEDVAAAMPRAFVKRSWLTRPRFSVRLSRLRTFTAGGFAGSITSNIRLSFTRVRCARQRLRSCADFNRAATTSG